MGYLCLVALLFRFLLALLRKNALVRRLKPLKAGEKDTVPPGVDPEHQKVRSAAVVLPRDKPYKDAAKEHLHVRTGTVHASV